MRSINTMAKNAAKSPNFHAVYRKSRWLKLAKHRGGGIRTGENYTHNYTQFQFNYMTNTLTETKRLIPTRSIKINEPVN